MTDLYIAPEFEVVRNPNRCIACRVCERQCANEVHSYDADGRVMLSDESKCVNCKRCVSLCPTHALKIVKNEDRFRENANWQDDTIKEIYKQANTGGVLLSSMLYFPLWIALPELILILAVCLVFGLLPAIMLLRRTPSEILAKYDI